MSSPHLASRTSDLSLQISRRMIRMYVDQRLSLRVIAEQYGCSHVAVLKRLVSGGVEPRQAVRRRTSVGAIIRRLALGETVKEASRELGFVDTAIRSRLAYRGLLVRDVRTATRRMSALQLDAYCKAIDEDGMSHREALEIALEYGEGD